MEAFKRPAFVVVCTLFAAWVLIAVFGTWLMPHGIDAAHRINLVQEHVNGAVKYVKPPFHPNGTFWFGTDHRGLDVLSLVLNGMKYTLGIGLLITLVRFLVALPIGLYAGLTGRGRKLVFSLQWIVSAVPAFVFLFPLLYGLYTTLLLGSGLPSNHPYQLLFTRVMFASVAIVGIFPIAYQFGERALVLGEKLFVHSSKLMGASPWRIVFRHLIPNLRAEIVFAFVAEFVQVLFLLGQLAVFGLYLGGGINLDYEDDYKVLVPQTGEWCAMIDYGIRNMRLYPWILECVGLFFTATVLILQLFAAQMKKQYRDRV